MLPQAERSQYARQLMSAEETARNARKKVWEGYVEPVEEEHEEGGEGEEKEGKVVVNGDSAPVDRKIDYQKVCLCG